MNPHLSVAPLPAGPRPPRAGARRAARKSNPRVAPPTPFPPDGSDAFSHLAVIERLLVRAPIRLLRACNTILDLMFYDVGALPEAQRRRFLESTDPDGSIVIVGPDAGGRRDVRHLSVDDFLRLPDLPSLGVVVIAGVGSSALGTAALAANVADALQRPVAGIVSGYGVADAVAEGLAGWFVLRPRNQLRQLADAFLAPWTSLLAAISRDTQPNGDPYRLVSYLRGFPESESLAEVLAQSRIGVAVAHSKGNLTLASVLEDIERKRSLPLSRFHVLTLGALVRLPPGLGAACQFLGALDAFGAMNSTWPQACVPVPWAAHTLNLRQGFPLNAATAVSTSGVDGRAQAPWPIESLARKLVDAALAPARFAADWLTIAIAAAIALGSAATENLRSLDDGAKQVARGARQRLSA